MPLVLHELLEGDTEIGVWHITESEKALAERLQLNEAEQAWLQTISHDKRYLHWLGSRVLLRWMLRTDSFIELENHANTKPRLLNFPHEVSISHSHQMAAVMISSTLEVGIDLELIHPKVLKVQERFLSEAELAQLDKEHPQIVEQLIARWCVKEALFKLYGRGKVDFRQELIAEPTADVNVYVGHIMKAGLTQPYTVHVKKLADYMIAYTAGRVPLPHDHDL
jgi:phosphopantetheine--protein transferase-like protein